MISVPFRFEALQADLQGLCIYDGRAQGRYLRKLVDGTVRDNLVQKISELPALAGAVKLDNRYCRGQQYLSATLQLGGRGSRLRHRCECRCHRHHHQPSLPASRVALLRRPGAQCHPNRKEARCLLVRPQMPTLQPQSSSASSGVCYVKYWAVMVVIGSNGCYYVA